MNLKLSKRLIVICTNPDGSEAWRRDVPNLTPTEMLNNALGILWKAVSPPATWYVLLVNSSGFGSFQASDTAAQIGGSNAWAEFTSYTGNRPAVVFGSVSGGSVNNTGAPSSFTLSGSGTLQGAALVTSNTPGGTSGFLGGEAAFGSPASVVGGQTITVQVVATAASA